jgi:hypothetical protein
MRYPNYKCDVIEPNKTSGGAVATITRDVQAVPEATLL